jgi:hypothetical protein
MLPAFKAPRRKPNGERKRSEQPKDRTLDTRFILIIGCPGRDQAKSEESVFLQHRE